ncbi:hypothetical protein V474_07975 [Novosphingobium barchaimii LL02]|uniref:Uncharacterized protein n=1 Tax=Novosphingobium barchaimii LL02 TaxID=1114963 RepID=A0A0J7Y7W7_9SPHN|nr:hypothetical protein [Novosphingobium barchaimii]KMS60009.1 hypothetical protein V474_07975 [Novosphingobium barchaimii LL02]
MKPNQLELRVDPADGRIFAVHIQRGKPVRKIKDLTDEISLCLCADLSADNVSKVVERSIQFSDGMVCEISVRMTSPPDQELRTRLDREYADGLGNGVEVLAA